MMKSRKNIALRAVFYVVIVIFVMIQIYPIFWVVCSSLKTPDEMTYTAQYALPSGFYLGNYISALTISSGPLCERRPGYHEPAAARRSVRDG